MLSSTIPVCSVPLSEVLDPVPLPLPEGTVTTAVSQSEAGGMASVKPSLPCGGSVSLRCQGRLVCIASRTGLVDDCVESTWRGQSAPCSNIRYKPCRHRISTGQVSGYQILTFPTWRLRSPPLCGMTDHFMYPD